MGKSGADLRVPAPGEAKKVAILGSLNHVTHELIVHTSPTKRSSDFVVHLAQIDALYGPMPGGQASPSCWSKTMGRSSGARIVLLAAAGLGVEETAQRLGIWRKTVGHWCRRWRDADASAGVAARLSDAPRCGAPATFTPEVICQIMALACEDPETLDVPISYWNEANWPDNRWPAASSKASRTALSGVF